MNNIIGFKIGDNVLVFNNLEWMKKGDLPEGNDYYYQPAKILNIGHDKLGELTVNVQFETGRISNGHFLNGIKKI